MKTIIFFLFLCYIGNIARAQTAATFDSDNIEYAIIKDTDGFVNVRKAPNSTAAVLGKIYKYDIFSCEPSNANWWKVLRVDNHDKSNWLKVLSIKTG